MSYLGLLPLPVCFYRPPISRRHRHRSTRSSPSCRRPPGPWACAIGRWGGAVRPACRTSGAALCRTRCSRAPPCRSAPMCRCDRNQPRWRPVALSSRQMERVDVEWRQHRTGGGRDRAERAKRDRTATGEKRTGLMGSCGVQHLRTHKQLEAQHAKPVANRPHTHRFRLGQHVSNWLVYMLSVGGIGKGLFEICLRLNWII